MTVVSPRLERYAAVAALPACAIGSAAVGDIVYTELNTSIFGDETASFTMAGASVRLWAFNTVSTYGGFSLIEFNMLTAIVGGGGIALNGGLSYLGSSPEAQGFAAGEEIGAGASFGGSNSNANLAATYNYKSFSYNSGGDWAAESRLFLGVELANGSDVNYGWIDVSWSGLNGAVIHGYAYETDVNTAIIAGATEGSGPVVPGAPTAVGLVGLAAGAAGIRRKRSA